MSDSGSSLSSASTELDPNDITRTEVMDKYIQAGSFAQFALDNVMKACVPGAKIIDLCKLGDSKILEKTNAVFNKQITVDGKKQKMDKGIAFPTCVTRNNGLGNFAPRSDDKTVLASGDVIKIELGVHLDGYMAIVCQTIVVDGEKDEHKAKDAKANAILAAHTALQGCIRGLRKGTTSAQLSELVKVIGNAYNVNAVEDVVRITSTKQFVIEASKQASIRARADDKNTESFEVEEGDVFTIEVAYSTGEGKCTNKEGAVTVFKRAVDVTYMLKLKASRTLFSEINATTPTLPFCIRAAEDKLGSVAKLGLKEISEHNLLHPYPVLSDKPDTTIAMFKVTCLVTPTGVLPLCTPTLPSSHIVEPQPKPEFPEKVNQVLALPIKTAGGKKKNKKAAAAADKA